MAPSTNSKQRVLLLCAEGARHTGTVADHLAAFQQYSRRNVFVFDTNAAHKVRIDLSAFDAIVFHYSIIISSPAYIVPSFAQRLAKFPGPKILFIQDEFRWVERTMAAVEYLGISVVFTVVNDDVVREIYRNNYFDRVRFEPALTGYVSEDLINQPVPKYTERPLDVSYRARKLPGWCGSFALQKWQIAHKFKEQARELQLRCDIETSEMSRLYGKKWIELLSNSKATLGTESGASFVDYTGDVWKRVEEFEAANPNASFEEVSSKFLEGRDGDVVIHVISPRCFEAACLRTLMILYPGEYSGILRPGRHYVELAPDHSNMAEVVSIIGDPDRASEIIHNAYTEIALSGKWSFSSFIKGFDDVLDDVLSASSHERHVLPLLTLEALEKKAHRVARRRAAMGFILNTLQAARFRADSAVGRLPPSIGRPIQKAGKIATRTFKPLLAKILLGRAE